MKISAKDFFTFQTADLVTFTEEVLSRKIHFLCNARISKKEIFVAPTVKRKNRYKSSPIKLNIVAYIITKNMIHDQTFKKGETSPLSFLT